MELIPAIDLRDGRCVRLLKGDFAAETVYSDDPASVLAGYRALGAHRVHVVDLDGARDGTQPNRPVVVQLARDSGVKLQVGGGLRSLDRIRELFAAGVDRAVIGSLAVTDPDRVMTWMYELDPRRFVLAFDVRLDPAGIPRLATHGWQQTSTVGLWSLLEGYMNAGLTHVLCTDISRDGTLLGPNLTLYSEATRRYPELHWQASGGIATGRDLRSLAECGVAAAISGRALLENKISPEELRPFLPNASSPAST
ncbi:MAG TPA: 1-(5-phosphoribosyl)-5-[(5-phosphoribosylamino)methylideneamino] imidazole-4-carboxamide isomerase [Steroidobacteraceae bacterium]|nr:1-(5-phosphoribosyl)-5-[(5-phosphoribosylamino)methylideneamino] imidazole-4-carboxamide isomerase [Steroidobacteraceae bacterium]